MRFDFLGFHFSHEGLSMAKKRIEKFLARAVLLYEQEREETHGSPMLGSYVWRWIGQIFSGKTLKLNSQSVLNQYT
jgi:hypothetical protein